MSENEVKKAFDAIEPEAGAQERMYANILKKAAAQQAAQAQAAQPAAAAPAAETRQKKIVPLWRRWGSLAACLAVVLAALALVPRLSDRTGPSDPPMLGISPFEDVESAADFSKLGFTIDAPEGAEDVSYCIYDGAIARVHFTLDGRAYTYEAAKLDGNFSRARGEAVGSTVLDARYGAVLDRISPDTWRAHWEHGGVSYYLTNFDGAAEADVTAAAQALISAP